MLKKEKKRKKQSDLEQQKRLSRPEKNFKLLLLVQEKLVKVKIPKADCENKPLINKFSFIV